MQSSCSAGLQRFPGIPKVGGGCRIARLYTQDGRSQIVMCSYVFCFCLENPLARAAHTLHAFLAGWQEDSDAVTNRSEGDNQDDYGDEYEDDYDQEDQDDPDYSEDEFDEAGLDHWKVVCMACLDQQSFNSNPIQYCTKMPNASVGFPISAPWRCKGSPEASPVASKAFGNQADAFQCKTM